MVETASTSGELGGKNSSEGSSQTKKEKHGEIPASDTNQQDNKIES